MSPHTHRRSKHIAFVSTMAGSPWGGSEMLWQGTALRLRHDGHKVTASVFRWPAIPPPIAELSDAGCTVHFRSRNRNALQRALDRHHRHRHGVALTHHDWRWLEQHAPDLVVVSQGYPLEGIEWMRACSKLGVPYASVIQAAGELWWPTDPLLDPMREAYHGADPLCFVSHSNHRVLERQCGMSFPHARVVSNPWNVTTTGAVPWPDDDGPTRLACVGRLDPRAKGQDLILEVLAARKWRDRPIEVHFYGHGPCESALRGLAAHLGTTNTCFHGRVTDVARIWAENHALILPSRFEGMPLAILEAMWCGRPVITTHVAGNAEHLREGVNGFIAEAPTAALLDGAMERAWAERCHWKRIGLRARADVLGLLPDDPCAAFADCLMERLTTTRDPS